MRNIEDLQKRLDKNNNGYYIEEYISDNNIIIRHEDCGFTFSSNFKAIGKSIKCKICIKGAKTLNLLEIKNQTLYYSNNTVEFLSNSYNGCKDQYTYKHLECGKTFIKTHDRFMAGERCSHCSKQSVIENKRLGYDKIKERIFNIYGDDLFILTEQEFDIETVDVHDYIWVKCSKCGSKYPVLIRHLLYEQNGCAECLVSEGEKIIKEYLTDKNIEFFHHYKGFTECKNIKTLEFDFYIPNLNMIIEFDGPFHDKPMNSSEYSIAKYENTKKCDNIKNDFCLNNNIKMVRIKYQRYNENIISELDKIFN